MIPFNKTKIVATLGPASSSYEVIKAMIEAGLDVCRLNLSHGEDSIHLGVIETIRAVNKELNTHVSILVDLQGPKLRIGEVEGNSILLQNGSEVLFTTHECIGNAKRLYMNYLQFPMDVAIGDRILIDDGKIQLHVTATNGVDEVMARVESGGKLSGRKGVNLPKTKISLPSLTPKDLHDLHFALYQGVDWIGLSFVRSAQDIIELKKIIAEHGKRCRVIAKIEKPEALNEIDQIIRETDALMVASRFRALY